MKYNLFPYSFVMSPKMSNKNDVIYGQVWWPILGICALHFNPSKVHTHTHTHTHTQQWTHTHSVKHTHSSERTHTAWTHTHTAVNTHTHREHTPGAVNTHTQQWTHTHQQWTHTHTVNTHRSSGQLFMRGAGEQLGVGALLKGHLSPGIEGGESAVHSLDYESDSLTIGPRVTTSHLNVSLINVRHFWRPMRGRGHGETSNTTVACIVSWEFNKI